MKKTNYTLLLVSLFMNFLQAQQIEEETTQNPLVIRGSVDAYFRANLDADFDVAPATSFANLPGFSLGMANLVLAQDNKKFGFAADLVFGPRGEDATFLSPLLRPGGSSNIVNQLYAYWKVTDAVQLTIGNFNTFLGYEVISPTGNFNYSTSYMFSYGPFSHTGLKADFDLGSGLSLMLGVFNPTDATEYNPTNDYAGGAQLGYENGGLTLYLNTLFSDGFTQFDITGGYDLTDDLYLGINATKASDSFTGIAGYLQYATSDNLKVGLRVESFTDEGLGLFENEEEINGSVVDVTVTASYKVGSLSIVPEFRLDSFSEDIVPKDDVLNSSLTSFLLAAIYEF